MKRKLFLLVGFVALLTGCTLIPKYTKPEAPVPSSWPSGPAYKEAKPTPGATGAADLKWRGFFTDERLQKIIETALNNNRDLRVASLPVERARALYRFDLAGVLLAIPVITVFKVFISSTARQLKAYGLV